MTIVFADSYFAKHQTGYHPECPARILEAGHFLDGLPWFTALPRGRIARASQEIVARTHAPSVLAAAEQAAASGGAFLDADTYLGPASFEVAMHAAGTSIAAVELVLKGEHASAFCLLRPPGHHAKADLSMGFCVFNNVAIAAHYARDIFGLQRILIVDFDVHHGNGTQDIFYEDPSVFFFSIHRFPFYPGSGTVEETGSGRGLGTTLNCPIAFGTSRKDFLERFRAGFETALARSKPELILISAGFDAHRADPIGSLGLEIEDYAAMTAIVRAGAEASCQGRVVSCLEGGYNLEFLPSLIAAHIQTLSGPSSPELAASRS